MTIQEIKQQEETKTSELFNECGVFWAFSKSQFAENKTPLAEGEQYVSIGGGGYMPGNNTKKLQEGMVAIDLWFDEAIKEHNQREAYIAYELSNHEAYYTWSIDQALESLGEGYTAAEVQAVFDKESSKHNT